MFRIRYATLAATLLAASAALAQERTPPPPAFDADACVKHCREMAESRQKMREDRKAAADRAAAAWKEIRSAVDEAKKARGEKKVAALETALDRLVAFHEQMTGEKPGTGMACCGGMAGRRSMMHEGPGGGMHGMPDGCGEMHGPRGETSDCPMMQKN